MGSVRATGLWRRPRAATLAWSLWFALLMGLPPVLSLPGAFSAGGVALAFSPTRTCMAFALLAGRAFAFGWPAARDRFARPLRAFGVVSTLGYVALLGASLASGLSLDAEMAVYLSFIATFLSLAAAFSCAVFFPNSVDEDSGEGLARSAMLVVAFAMLSVAALVLSVGFEPCLTLARSSFSGLGTASEGEWWQVLAYDFAGVVGPGVHPLRLGTPGVGISQLFVFCAWLALGIAASSAVGAEGLGGAALGVLACRWVVSCAGFDAALAGPLGLALLALSVTLLLTTSLWGKKAVAVEGEPGENLRGAGFDAVFSVLSSREREAVEGRLQGLSSSEIAQNMGIKPSTVRNLQARALTKLDVTSFDDLCAEWQLDRGRSLGAEKGEPATSMSALLGFIACLLFVLLLLRLFAGGAWTCQALTGEVVVAASLLAFGSALLERDRCSEDPVISAAWVLLALQLGLCLAVLTNGEKSLSPLALALALACLVIELVLVLRGRHASAWGVTVWGFACFVGLGLVLGAWISWPLATGQGMLLIRERASGVIGLSAIAGFVFGAVLLLGLVSASYVSLACRSHEELEAMRRNGESGLEFRTKAFLASRGLNKTQVDVAWAVMDGMGREQIAKRLCLSTGAVNSAKRDAYRLLGVHSAAELINLALRVIK